jgi:crotonobetainyl-CoA:carnitine CoA-transferase CaiB-like acyl-CoA transferase
MARTRRWTSARQGTTQTGPYATLLMAKAGADVIKIEPPQGEPLRRRAPPGKSTTFPIAMLNSNKRAGVPPRQPMGFRAKLTGS